MKRFYQALLGLLLTLTLAITPTLPLWSQTPEPISNPPTTSVGKSGTYEAVPCAILTASPSGADEAANRSPFPSEAKEGDEYECGYLTVPELL